MAHTAFPPDLVQAQRAWNHTYAQLAESEAHYTLLRRRLLRLSARLVWHPFWETVPGGSPAARVELRELARAPEERPARPAGRVRTGERLRGAGP